LVKRDCPSTVLRATPSKVEGLVIRPAIVDSAIEQLNLVNRE
jgi:hypothetical protein